MHYFNQYYFSERDQRQARAVKPKITTIRPAVNLIETSFKRSLTKTLQANQADKKIGLLLSGGIDSSLLLAMVKTLTDKEIVCFTAMTDADDPDVTPSEEVTRALNIQWKKCRLAKDGLPKRLSSLLPQTHGGLYSTANNLALDICMEYCRHEGINNLWAGNGLDMFFGGGVNPESFKSRSNQAFHEAFWNYTFSILKNRFYHEDGKNLDELAKKHAIKLIMPFENFDSILCARSIRADLFFLYGEDKYPVRLLARRYGVPLHEARRQKEPLQISSGIFDLLRDYMYDSLPNLMKDAVNFKLTKNYFENNPNNDLQLFLTMLSNSQVIRT